MATKMMDIGLVATDTGVDAAVVAGDFTVVESTAQHQTELILDNPGEFKQNPSDCVGAFGYLNGEDLNDLIGIIARQFAKDGMDVRSIGLDPTGVIVSDAFYP